MKAIKPLILHYKKLQSEIEKTEEELKKLKEQKQNILRKQIPDILLNEGLNQVSVDINGQNYSIKIAPYIYYKMQGDSEEEKLSSKYKVVHFLMENLPGSKAGINVITSFNRGTLEKISEIINYLHSAGLSCDIEPTIHHKTLESEVKRYVREYQQFPREVPIEVSHEMTSVITNL